MEKSMISYKMNLKSKNGLWHIEPDEAKWQVKRGYIRWKMVH